MFVSVLLGLAGAAQGPVVRQELQPLAFLVGHCWRAEFPRTGEHDIQCFEPVYEGQHVRSRHQVNGGKSVYRGETLFSSDGRGVTFTYWNSLGGVSRGTMSVEGAELRFGDESYTAPDGRKLSFSTTWRPVGKDAFDAVTISPGDPSLNRTLRYRRLPAKAGLRSSPP